MNKTYTKVSSQQHSTFYHLKIHMYPHITFCCTILSMHTRTLWFTVCHTNTKRWKDFVRRKQNVWMAVACGSKAIDAFHSLQTAQTQTKLIIKYKRSRNVRLLLQGRPVSARWMGFIYGGHHHHAFISHTTAQRKANLLFDENYEKTLTFVCSLYAHGGNENVCVCVCMRRRLLFVFISCL